MTSDLLAEEIAEDVLYKAGKVLAEGRVEDIGAHFEVPQIVETPAGKRLVETEADLCQIFASQRDYLTANGITDIVRTVISSEFLAIGVIGSTHVSQLMRADGSPFRAPYPSYSIIRKSNGCWRMSSRIHAIFDNPEHVAALSGNLTVIEERG